MHFQPNDFTEVLELKDVQHIGDDMELHINDVAFDVSVTPPKPRWRVMLNDVVSVSTESWVMWLEQTAKSLKLGCNLLFWLH